MAGVAITIDYQFEDAVAAVFGLIGVMIDPTDMFRNMGDALIPITVNHWATQASPDGTPWDPLSPKYQRRKDKKRPGAPILVYDNYLRETLRYQVIDGTLYFGTDRPYGATQQFGRGNIPARVWLGTNAADDQQLVDIALEHLQAGFAGS